MADIVRSVMEETGISVTDLLAAATEIACLEYPSELARCRDEIIQRLYGGVQCVECTDVGKEHVASTVTHETEKKAQKSPMDSAKENFSGLPEVAVKGSNDQEKPAERRPLRVVIRLKNKENLPAKATERRKSDICEEKFKTEGGSEFTNMGKEHVASTKTLETEKEAQKSPLDGAKENFSGLPEVAVKGNNDQEKPSERRPLRVVIRLKNNKNLSAKATERHKSDSSEEKNLSVVTTEQPKSKMDRFQNIAAESEEYIQRFEKSKRKFQEKYEMVAQAKKQRSVKMLPINELPEPVKPMTYHKSAHAPSRKFFSRSRK